MRSLLLPLLATVPIATLAAQQPDPYLALAKKVLSTTPLIDGHNDLPWRIREDKSMTRDVEAYDLRKRTPGHTDFDRLRKGMLRRFWSVYIPGEVNDSGYARFQLEQIDIMKRVIERFGRPLQC